MIRTLRYLALVALMVGWAASPSVAAEGATTVKVALLDMSSVMPSATSSYGMMGPGMMMGPEYWGQGNGAMRPGMSGQYGMMGPGMMGPGMMGGMMTIRADKQTVKAGPVAFDVTNWSRSVLHEMLVVSVDSPSAPLPYDYAQARVPEDQVKVLGEAADLEPNAAKTLNLTLAPGSYLLICNLPGHYAAGMVLPLTVTQ